MSEHENSGQPENSAQHDHADHDHADHDHAGHEGDNCQEAIAELYSFLDGELTEAKRHDISQHLDDCSPCLEAFEFETELRAVVSHRCQEQVPDSLRQKVADLLAGAAADPTTGTLADH